MAMQHVQTKREIETLLAEAGIRPRKRFGQHFLIDGNLMRRLCAAGEIESGDRILEVGGGTGGLTDLLVGSGEEVVCVEVDDRLHAVLESRFADCANFRLILGDVLEGKHRLHPDVAQFIHDESNGRTVKLIANLPYQVATPLVMNLLIDYPEVKRLVFTVQREVADRFTAEPGQKEYGPVSIVVQLLCRVQTVATLPPDVFWPRPEVESAMMRLDVEGAPFPDREALRAFVDLVRGTFEHRRKTLRSALSYVVDEGQRDAVGESIDATRRPQSLSIEEWLEVYRTVSGAG